MSAVVAGGAKPIHRTGVVTHGTEVGTASLPRGGEGGTTHNRKHTAVNA